MSPADTHAGNRPDPECTSPKVDSARALAEQYPEDRMHLEQVTRLATMLFDASHRIHRLGELERDLLCCAALLHDIGISQGFKGHHKSSLKMIQQADLPALTTEERDIVANVARYHRKAAPGDKHKAYRALSPEAQELVRRLAALLRLADGLDRAHENAVGAVKATFSGRPVQCRIELHGAGDLAFAAWGARRKAGLFEDVFGMPIRFEPEGRPDDGGRSWGA